MQSETSKISPQVVREVSGQSTGPEESASPIIPRKTELDKVSVEEVPACPLSFFFRKT